MIFDPYSDFYIGDPVEHPPREPIYVAPLPGYKPPPLPTYTVPTINPKKVYDEIYIKNLLQLIEQGSKAAAKELAKIKAQRNNDKKRVQQQKQAAQQYKNNNNQSSTTPAKSTDNTLIYGAIAFGLFFLLQKKKKKK